METRASSSEIGAFERWLVRIDVGPFGALYRVAIGLAIIPAMSLVWENRDSDWTLVPFLLAVLMLLRVLPAIVRMLVPFSDSARIVWAARRRMAKQHDSYQWRKLLWIGVGLALYTAASDQLWRSRIVVCSICLLTGVFGMLRWRVVSRQQRSATGLPAEEAQRTA